MIKQYIWFTIFFCYRIGQVITEFFQRPWLGNSTIRSFSALGKERDQLLKILHGFTEEVGLNIKMQNSFSWTTYSYLFKVIHNRREVLKKKESNKTEETETGISM